MIIRNIQRTDDPSKVLEPFRPRVAGVLLHCHPSYDTIGLCSDSAGQSNSGPCTGKQKFSKLKTPKAYSSIYV